MKSAIPAYVYGLRDKDSDRYFYVGSTKQSIQARLHTHQSDARLGRLRNRHLASKLRLLGKSVVTEVLCETNQAERFIQEEAWISRLLAEGHPLCNHQLTPSIYREAQRLYTYTGKEIARKACWLMRGPRGVAAKRDVELANAFERVAVRMFRHAMLMDGQGFIDLCRSNEVIDA